MSSTVHYFCTYFDRNYLFKGLALYRSMVRHIGSFALWVLCFDEDTYNILYQMNLPEVRLIALDEFERDDPELLKAKQTRSKGEYYWTCTPSLLLFVLRHNPEIDVITYLDADMFLYADPRPIYEELGGQAILIVEHRYAPKYMSFGASVGIYNVGVLAFTRNEDSLSCLRWWRDRCLEWCFSRVEAGRFGDQKYLDDWPSRFRNVLVLQHKGVDVGPWNISNYKVCSRNGRIYIDDDELIIYHFHALSIIADWLFELAFPVYAITREQVRLIYRPYLRELRLSMRQVRELDPDFKFGYTKLRLRGIVRRLLLRRLFLDKSPL